MKSNIEASNTASLLQNISTEDPSYSMFMAGPSEHLNGPTGPLLMSEISEETISTMSKDNLRAFISHTIKKVACSTEGTTFPGSKAVLSVCRELGYDNVSEITAYADLASLRSVASVLCKKLTGVTPIDATATATAIMAEAQRARMPERRSARSSEGEDLLLEENEFTKALADAEKHITKLREAAAAASKRTATSAVSPDLLERIDGMDRRLDTTHGVVKAVVKDVADCNAEVGRIKPVIDAIMAALPAATPPPPRVVAAVAAAVSPTKDRMLEAVRPFFTPGLEQTCAIPAVVSPPSFGKTYMADTIAGLYEASFLHPFKDDIDEISSLVGTVTPRPDGTLLTADGPLTAAIRSAQAGTKTLFIGDEIFNATRKTLEWMLSTLSPRVHAGKRCYILQTRQVEEDGTFEILRAPVENLHILFMGNLRTSPPEAFASRVQLLRFDFSKGWAKEVCLQRMEYFSGGEFKPSAPAVIDWADKFSTLMEATRARYSTLELARPLCFRFLIAAVQNVCRWEASPTVGHLSEYFNKYLPQQIAVQNAATQDTDPTSKKLAEELVKLIDL